jgi:hypothetical protein
MLDGYLSIHELAFWVLLKPNDPAIHKHQKAILCGVTAYFFNIFLSTPQMGLV